MDAIGSNAARKMRSVMAVLGCMFVFGLVGCEERDAQADVAQAQNEAAEELAEAREEAAKEIAAAEREVADARREFRGTSEEAGEQLREVEKQALDKRAEAGYELAITKAEARHKVSLEQCDGLERELQNACIADADANLVVDRAAARSQREAALAVDTQVDD